MPRSASFCQSTQAGRSIELRELVEQAGWQWNWRERLGPPINCSRLAAGLFNGPGPTGLFALLQRLGRRICLTGIGHRLDSGGPEPEMRHRYVACETQPALSPIRAASQVDSDHAQCYARLEHVAPVKYVTSFAYAVIGDGAILVAHLGVVLAVDRPSRRTGVTSGAHVF